MKAVLWDLDDTLLNTLPARLDALAWAHERCLGARTDALALWRSHRGGTLEELGKRLLGDDAARFVTAYRERYYATPDRAKPFEGIVDLLEAQLEAGLLLAVVTSKISYGATEELSQAGLLPFFASVVAFDDTDAHKPDPEPIYTAMERLCVDEPAEVAFVGDSPADIFAARNAGTLGVAALWGTLDEHALRAAEPRAVAVAPGDVSRYVQPRGRLRP